MKQPVAHDYIVGSCAVQRSGICSAVFHPSLKRKDRERVSDVAEIKMINNNNNDGDNCLYRCLTRLLRHLNTGFSNSLSGLSLPPSTTDYIMSGIYYTTLSSCKKKKKRPLAADTRH